MVSSSTSVDAHRPAGLVGVGARMLLAWGWLLAWHTWYGSAPCLLALGFLVPMVFFVLLGVTETALLRRRAVLSMYLRPESWLFRLLRGGAVLIAWQTIKALALGVLLLVASVSWEPEVWAVLGLDALLLALLFRAADGLLGPHARPGYAGMLVRRLLVPINSGLLLLAVVVVELHTAQPDLRGISLVEAIEAQVAQAGAACAGVAILARAAAALDALGWWLAETQLTRPELVAVAPAAWLAFLAVSLGFVWAYSRLLLGVLVSPLAVQGLLSRHDHPEAES
jgi:hypothetical protein